jgi:valyl-tRNA synthetase
MSQDSDQDIPKSYDPAKIERRIYETWLAQGHFAPQMDSHKQPYVVIMPPPNVTGELHLGHAITIAIEDALVRWHRMRGDPTLWLPGVDHAGIATQVVVERELATEGVTRQELGREAFVARVWAWVEKYGETIDGQLQYLGASCDWTRRRFTLEEVPSNAVRRTFVDLFNQGLIYRGERIINWCPRCATALSDLEVDHQDENGHLYYIRYRRSSGDGHLTVATTRPETLFGDTAVAMNPQDPRFPDYLGSDLILPLLGREIPVVGDEAVDVTFGTGALKITPGHDPTDFEVGQRHGLPIINAMNLDGTLNDAAGPYAGMDRYEAREAIVRDLARDNLLDRVEPYSHSVGHCQRCDTIVEPLVSKQWFIQMSPLAQPAIEAVLQRRIEILPERFTRVYLSWMENIRDWCISRQLWWGHRIPVWYCDDCGEQTVLDRDPSSCNNCGSSGIWQDPDVLDTWFSSALWPHSTLGWPEATEDYRYFYPSSVMETGYDILFFWVARMIMMGIWNTGDIPFKTVFLHGLVRDPSGKKMSKSVGNVVDPLDLIKQFGTDAVRFALTTGITPGNDTRVSESKFEAARNFCNKLWNAARFVMLSLQTSDQLDGWEDIESVSHLEDQWILSRLNRLILRTEDLLNQFQIGEAEREIYEFLWNEYCDWYIELAKIRLRQGDTTPLTILAHVLEKTLRLLHPFMPFITEETWQLLLSRLPPRVNGSESIMIAPYPIVNEKMLAPSAEIEMNFVIELIRGIRNVRGEFRIPLNQQLKVFVNSSAHYATLTRESEAIRTLGRVETLHIDGDLESTRSYEKSLSFVLDGAVATLPLEGFVDLDQERTRLLKESTASTEAIQSISHRLGDDAFLQNAPPHVVERERQRLITLNERHSRIQYLLERLDS